MATRESIYAAVFALLSPLVGTTLKTTSRRLEFAEKVANESLPAVYQNQTTCTPKQETFGGAFTWDLSLDWYVYGSSNVGGDPSTPTLNDVLDAVCNLIPSEKNQVQFEVDGVAYALGFAGPIMFWEGLLNDRSVARIPLTVGDVVL